ncbi:toxin biosynthesis protein (Tri7), putative [Macrophomina phaseolina MS6]|uniref:Toxin biosynthesis protein (Tri7), putative n=1 Tax=Macrophomina phaseolina (strain MS6) TaxID=1126212 RepID=K2QIF3_MACPH|nr:toxin biosynthesis protein (Tri7), putative [Macrophomina phaseolina MS6]
MANSTAPIAAQAAGRTGISPRLLAWSSLVVVVTSTIQLSRAPKTAPKAVAAAVLLAGCVLVVLGATVPFLWEDRPFFNIMTNFHLCMFLLRGFEVFFSGKVFTARPEDDDKVHPLGETVSVFMNQRKVGLPYQVKKLAPFSYADRTWVPGRARFLLTLAARLALFWLLIDAFEHASGEPDAALFAEERTHFFSRLGEVTAEQVQQAMAGTAMNWALAYIIITIQADAWQLGGTLVGAYRPADCPPMFGRPRDAYSVRQFWGTAWHQQLRFLADIAEYAVNDVLRVRRGTLVSRYGRMYATFMLSGALHVAGEMATFSGRTWADSHSFWFFHMQWLAIVLEDAAQALFRRATGRAKRADGDEPALWERLAGYGWTFVWLSYTTPRYAYPAARHPTPGICATVFDPIGLYLKRRT